MEVVVSSSHVVSAAPSSSGGGLLILFPCSSVGSHPQETVLHRLLQHESFPRGTVLQGQTAPVGVPQGLTSPASKPAPAWAPLSTGPQVLAGACSNSGSPWGPQPPLGTPTCSSMGSSVGYRWISAPAWTPMGCGEQPASPQAFRVTSAPVPGAPPPPPSSPTLVSAGLFLSLTLTPLST